MIRVLVSICFILIVSPAFATTTVKTSDERSELLANLKSAENEVQGRLAEDAIRRYWLIGPTKETTGQLLNAMQARRYYDFERALKLLNAIIKKYPDYAEAYNQRAFVYFLQRKFDEAHEDVNRALELEPQHFGALTGRAIIFIHQGRIELARNALRQAVSIHPWLRERELLAQMPAGKK